MSKKVYAMFFSATGTTKKVVTAIAADIASAFNYELVIFDFTTPENRVDSRTFSSDDIVILGTPVYAGRVPNVLLKYINTITAQGAFGIPVVLFGNRNYDDALIELKTIMDNNGFKTIAAGAFVGAHAFSTVLAKSRPDKSDMKKANELALKAIDKIKANDYTPFKVNGNTPIRPYYTPLGLDGNPVAILKVKPLTNDSCDNCGICASVCPMGSIDPQNPKQYIGKGICIKCGACIKKCPKGAKYYTNEEYLSHKAALERDYSAPKEVEIFY